MTATVAANTDVGGVLAGAYGAAVRTGRVGTEHLLVALAGAGPAAAVLDEFQVTPVAALSMLRAGGWRSHEEEDAHEAPLGDLEYYAGRKPMNYTGAARAALRSAMAGAAATGRCEFDTVDLLRALLSGPNRAGELLARCGVDADRLRARLAQGTPVVAADPVPPELRRTRDLLLGRERYRPASPVGRLAAAVLHTARANPAGAPVGWIALEAADHARRLGHRRAGSVHVLLGVLATYRVAAAYPHLAGDVDGRYRGGRVLSDLGVDYRSVLDAAGDADDRPASAYLRGRRDSAAVVLAILDGPTPAARLLGTLGVAPERVRARVLAG